MKNERGYRLNAIKKRFLPNNLASIQIEKIATSDLDRKNKFNSKQIIQILQPIVIDYLSPHLYIFNIS